MVKVLLDGCYGRMDKVIIKAMKNFPNIEIVAGIDRCPNDQSNFKIYTNSNDVDISYDVLLDFSRPEALTDILKLSTKNNKPAISCSTGYTDEELLLILEKSKVIPLFRSANMSLGVNLLNSLLKKIVPALYENYDIEIIGKHHNQEVDSPSGTALLLVDTIKDSIPNESNYTYGRSRKRRREEDETGIRTIRGGSIVGDHGIIFAGSGEVIELSHKAISREIFAVGALRACEFMSDIIEPKLYNTDDVLGI